MITEKLLEICKNLQNTINTMSDSATVGDRCLKDNNIWSATKPTKKQLEKKLKRIMDKYHITEAWLDIYNNKEIEL
mgnify:CR=1 FL=1